jgi:hypothetical protein
MDSQTVFAASGVDKMDGFCRDAERWVSLLGRSRTECPSIFVLLVLQRRTYSWSERACAGIEAKSVVF